MLSYELQNKSINYKQTLASLIIPGAYHTDHY